MPDIKPQLQSEDLLGLLPGQEQCANGAGEDGFSSSPSTSQLSSSDTYSVGYVIVNVVGEQLFSGTINRGEMVSLVREPLKTRDKNAIRVINKMSDQVGRIDKKSAKVLAPLIDDNLVTIQGVFLEPQGRRKKFRIPCEVHIFARTEIFGRVKLAIANGGLELMSENNSSFTLSDTSMIKEKRSDLEEKSVDEIFKLLELKASNEAALEAVEPPKAVIKPELFLHQKQGLGWLVHRENSSELPPFWVEKNGVYVNELTNSQTGKRPEPLRGGIFADDMGLGKTLTLLSLIAFDKCAHKADPSTYNSRIYNKRDESDEEGKVVASTSKRPKKGRRSKNKNDSKKKQKLEDHEMKIKGKLLSGSGGSVNNLEPGATLIVCPPSVFSSWKEQLREHTIRGSLEAYMYHGKRTKDADELRKYDIVFTTYATLAAEESMESPIKKIEWRRVILDEAHTIKNDGTQQSRAVCSLNSKCRWVVTGTPIQNDLLDLYSFMVFLKLEPFSNKSHWKTLISCPIIWGDMKGISRLQVLMTTVSLRRTKDRALVRLPSKSIETFIVNLSDEERDAYDQLEAKAKRFLQGYVYADDGSYSYRTILGTLTELRQVCTHMELCRSLPSQEEIIDVRNNRELHEKLLSELQDGINFDCPICMSPQTNIVITRCGHIFCRSCILKTLESKNPRCPICRRPLSESDIFKAPPSSSKITALLKLSSTSRDECSATKTVIFTQFVKIFPLLEKPLKEAGFKVTHIHGKMTAEKRSRVIEEFGAPEPEGPTILLASLKACGAGINLTAASRVYLLEPWWNPAAEEQAMDRVYRIGQTKDVKIVRMIARDTIEEKILRLQEKRKLLARKALGTKHQREISKDDLRVLMGYESLLRYQTK